MAYATLRYQQTLNNGGLLFANPPEMEIFVVMETYLLG
jgi:hypothetical protein